MINWRPEYIALLNRLYWTQVLKQASTEAYYEANREIGRAAKVRPGEGETIESVVERWITGEQKPTAVQGERLVRWAATVGWHEQVSDNVWVWVTIAEKLSELIKDSKRGG